MTEQHANVLDDLFTDDDDSQETRRRPPQLRRWRYLAAAAGIAAVAATGFAVGRTTADDAGGAGGLPAGFEFPTGATSGTEEGPGGDGGRAAFGGGLTTGELTAIDDDEWLITDSSGNTIRVRVSDDTTYRKTESVTEDDIAIGDNVTVIGEEQDDGSVNADSVQSGESGGFGGPPGGFGGGRGGPGSAPDGGGESTDGGADQ